MYELQIGKAFKLDPLEYCHIVFSNENRVDFERYVTRNNSWFLSLWKECTTYVKIL